ncbi:type II toxin-antitoxin system prevent-host-death family antitoxin [Deinococcus deserti]|uniref:type II toxin-antitoxin system prevent-host-death family antitoxin n=1 Tax=Deinococcus deserti TaxID=310783 RepID=UPI0039E98E16
MPNWPYAEAQARLNETLERAADGEPQRITQPDGAALWSCWPHVLRRPASHSLHRRTPVQPVELVARYRPVWIQAACT